jgi:hypothetical protein
MPNSPQFPTNIHKQAAEEIVDFATTLPVQAVLLVNSCARGKATAQSDLDVALLIDPELPASDRQHLDHAWSERYRAAPIFRELEQLGRFSCVHLDFFDGQWTPEVWDDGGGPDGFEIEIGNRVAYSTPLWEGGKMFADLRARWLPHYGEELRNARLKMVTDACLLDFERIPFLVARGLNFYAFRPALSRLSGISPGAVHRAPHLSHCIQQVDPRADRGLAGIARSLLRTSTCVGNEPPTARDFDRKGRVSPTIAGNMGYPKSLSDLNIFYRVTAISSAREMT